ncbi:MAG: tyrosine-protein phosphatase [Actinobacteria bacterium]|nr:tyrosine-protein phosphatase [Actinomycetota bacterium]MCG2817927.1 tyrosine-protein phosphatase [Actinomycetes bacterium]MBU4179772.1 tyrosine-protein phosphatase [Actinomycetota bacterium]MBU4219735.1 tyrosine-protein phosphatase [Actinomycetota bacterium]MBU4357857.1 tyrosine-protein phosphatase [Actinomycetota bacterium]
MTAEQHREQDDALHDPRRHVQLGGAPNFRDLGGYGTIDGRTVRWGLVYRSGELGRLTDMDIAKLERIGIRTAVDFRSELEVEHRGEDRLPEGARGVAIPIDPGDLAAVLEQLFTPGNLSGIPPDYLAQVNRALIRDFTGEYAKLMREVADPDKRPLVLHCTHGKDRAGMGTAIILSVLGVPWPTVVDDHLLSNVYRREENEEQLAQIREAMAEQKGIPAGDVDTSCFDTLFWLTPAEFDATHQAMTDNYGSVESYIREGLGISDEMRDRLRDELLE